MARLMVAIALMLSAGCQAAGSSRGCTDVQIDWVDFIVVGSTQYEAGLDPTVTLTDADLGPVVAHVKFKVQDNVCDPGYHPKDGDAAFLEPGTPIYQVKGRPAGLMLAARHDGKIWAYEAHSPTAGTPS